MNLDRAQKVICLTAYCAANPARIDDFDTIIAAARQDGLLKSLGDAVTALDAPRLKRCLARPIISAEPLDWDEISLDGDAVLWEGKLIGRLTTLYKKVFPQEAQARIAYEVLLDRFFRYLHQKLKIAVLHDGDVDVTLFVPQMVAFSLQAVWDDFIDRTFSAEGLRSTFVPLVNSIRLTGRGFSTIAVPIVSEAQALYLAAFYRVNLASLEAGDAQRQRELAQRQKKLISAQGEKERKKLEKTIKKIEEDLKTRIKRYETTYEALANLRKTYPRWMEQVERVAHRELGGQASLQLNKRANIVAKYVEEMERLATMLPSNYFRPDPLVSDALPVPGIRPGGDSGGKMCYACGHIFTGGETKYKANKFIFEAPSQRLQSGSGQMEPKICATCAAVSFVSPIKTGSDRLVIRLRRRDGDQRYLLEDQLRMLTLGELNVIAGRYALIQAHERVPKKGGRDPLPERMGGRQYALYKVASLFTAEVFRSHRIEALIGDAEVSLPGQHLSAVRGLLEVFRLDSRRWWEDKGQFAAVAQAVRYVESEKLTFAVYELLKQWRQSGLLLGRLDIVQSSRLEQLYETHGRWLMEEKPKEAQLFRDVAGMTGLLYAFGSFVHQSVKADERRIEVRKLIERATEPYGFIYTAAGNTKREMATLYRQADLYFSYDQAKGLLAELGVNPDEREGTTDQGTLSLTLYFDDVVNAYTHLFETRYRSPKEQRDFTYTLRLSLHARFPELIEPKEGE